MTQFSIQSSTGLVRSTNQDRAFSDGECIFVVADGMGGYRDGAAAAEEVIFSIETIARKVREKLGPNERKSRFNLLNNAIRNAHEKIRSRSNLDGYVSGTTVAIAVVHSSGVEAYWIGDSRIYGVSGRAAFQCTIDHTLAEEKRQTGRANLIFPNDHHTLTKCIGISGYDNLDSVEITDEHPDLDGIFLCSDGYDMVTSDEIASTFMSRASLSDRVEALGKLVADRGAPDNYTSIAVEFSAT